MDLEPLHDLRDEALRLLAAVRTASDGDAPSVTGSHAGARVTIDGRGTVSEVAIDSSWRQGPSAGSPADFVLLAYREACSVRLQSLLERIEENSARPSLEHRLKAANTVPDPPRPSAAAAEQAMSQIRDLGGIRIATQDMIKALTGMGQETFEARLADGRVVARANRQREVTYLNVDLSACRDRDEEGPGSRGSSALAR